MPNYSQKENVCQQLRVWLCEQTDQPPAVISHQILEILLHQVSLCVNTGRYRTALKCLQEALKQAESPLLERLTVKDCCLAWLTLIHLQEFRYLPSSLFDPANSNPGRIVAKVGVWVTYQYTIIHQIVSSLQDHFRRILSSCDDRGKTSNQRHFILYLYYININFINFILLQ